MLEKTIKKVLDYINRNKALVITGFSILVFFLSYQTKNLKVDNSLESWFTEDDPALESYYSFIEKFGNDEVIVTVITDSVPYYDSIRLKKIIELTQNLENINGIAHVRSLANTPLSYSLSKKTIVDIFKEKVIGEKIKFIRKGIEKSEINSRFIGISPETIVLYSWLDTLPEIEAIRGEVIRNVHEIAQQSLISKSGEVNMGGVGILFEGLNQVTFNEGGKLIVLSYFVLIICIIVATRSFLVTISTLIVVSLASVFMYGFMGLLGRSLNMVSLALPPLIMVMGVSNMIHITKHLKNQKKSVLSEKFLFTNALAIISTPILFNALTTASGFFSLTTANMAITRDYGLFAAIGVLSVFVFSILASVIIGKKITEKATVKKHRFEISRLIKEIFLIAIRRKYLVLVFSILLFVVSIVGICKINVDTLTIDFLPKNHLVRTDNISINSKTGNYIPLEFLIKLDKSWKSIENINKIDKLQTELEQHNQIEKTFSIVDIVKEANQNKITSLSQSKAILIANQLEKEAIFKSLISDSGKTVRLTINVPMLSANEFNNLANYVINTAEPILNENGKLSKSGYLPLYSNIVNQTVTDQIKSLSLAFLVIVLLIMLILKSWKFSLLAIPSNLLPIFLVLAFMGFTKMRLDIATITVAATVFGIIVDDSLHILYNLKSHLKKGIPLPDAFSLVAEKTGSAVVITSIVLTIGYSIVAFGDVKLISNSGFLMIIAIISALITDLLLLPALFAIFFKPNAKHSRIKY